MGGATTRRAFLGSAAAAGSSLLLQRHGDAARTEASQASRPALGDAAAVAGATAARAPLVVITQTVSRDVDPRAVTWTYITEILEHAGVFFESLPLSRLPSLAGRTDSIVLLAGNLRLTPEQRSTLSAWVARGGWLIGIGGTSGLDDVFGVSDQRPLAEGWIKVTAKEHAVTRGLRSSLHVFGGHAVTVKSAAALATIESGSQGAKGSAVVENRFAKGHALLLAPDLVFSIVHIQQGLPVLQDGRPAPDGSAPIDDGELKAEDGCVLDWRRDRTAMQPDGEPAFLEPISDELREIILRGIFHAAHQHDIPLPVLWYWPRGLKAVGHISHDSDGNDPARAVAMLDVMNRCRVKSTWCMLYPGGYPKEFYRTLKKQGFEIGLHYDARSGGRRTSWSKENLVFQHRWLLQEAELERIVSNKNHYTRWEGRLDFWRWCQQVGIKTDQTRGPSKKGMIGFPLGGSHPYFPLDDEARSPRRLNVLEVNLITQDLVVVCPAEYGRQFLDSVSRHHGVAHFLFHPAHIVKPHVADALRDLVDYGRANGLQWWTSRQIYHWEMLRRGVTARFDSANVFTLRAAKPLADATVLLLKTRRGAKSIHVNGQPVQGSGRTAYGFEFAEVTMDVAGEVGFRVAVRDRRP